MCVSVCLFVFLCDILRCNPRARARACVRVCVLYDDNSLVNYTSMREGDGEGWGRDVQSLGFAYRHASFISYQSHVCI